MHLHFFSATRNNKNSVQFNSFEFRFLLLLSCFVSILSFVWLHNFQLFTSVSSFPYFLWRWGGWHCPLPFFPIFLMAMSSQKMATNWPRQWMDIFVHRGDFFELKILGIKRETQTNYECMIIMWKYDNAGELCNPMKLHCASADRQIYLEWCETCLHFWTPTNYYDLSLEKKLYNISYGLFRNNSKRGPRPYAPLEKIRTVTRDGGKRLS